MANSGVLHEGHARTKVPPSLVVKMAAEKVPETRETARLDDKVHGEVLFRLLRIM
jgi:hypothetical protein